jgi:hypothetical protein
MERNDTSNKRKAAQAPSARLLAADELGLLKGKQPIKLPRLHNLLVLMGSC